MADKYLKTVEPNDNVATALREVEDGETVEVKLGEETRTVPTQDAIQFGHKIALEDISAGDTVWKYGLSIGNASEDIEAGEWVHVHNIESNYGRGDTKQSSD